MYPHLQRHELDQSLECSKSSRDLHKMPNHGGISGEMRVRRGAFEDACRTELHKSSFGYR